jgi:predicted transcriptional regulator of viral defense system
MFREIWSLFMKSSISQKIVEIVKKIGVLRPRDLKTHGIDRKYLNLLCNQGILKRVSRGLYISADAEISPNFGLVQAAKWIPHGVVCLLSALQFHNIGTQSPFEVWLAIDHKAWRPQIDYPPIRIIRFSGKALTEGIEEHKIEGVSVKIYNPAKTVADCFKYRNKIGLDVALEALRDCRENKKCTNAELWKYAKICRVTKIMEPYLEAIV